MSKKIQQIVEFNASPSEVYELLMDEKKHAAFTGDDAQVLSEVGGEFSVWGGYATGTTIELVPNKKIVQKWRASDWPEGIYSQVTFEFVPKGEGSELHFTQVDVPEESIEDIDQGWKDNYWQLMKEYLNKK